MFFNNKLYFTASNLQNTWYRRSGSWQWQKQALCECFLCSLDTDLYFTALIYKICDIKEVKASSGENRPKWHNWCCLGLRWVLFKLSSCFLTITHILRHVIYKICDIEEGVEAGSGKNRPKWWQLHHGIMVIGHTGMGAVSKFQTQGHTMTHHHSVMGFLQCSDVTIKYIKIQNFFPILNFHFLSIFLIFMYFNFPKMVILMVHDLLV